MGARVRAAAEVIPTATILYTRFDCESYPVAGNNHASTLSVLLRSTTSRATPESTSIVEIAMPSLTLIKAVETVAEANKASDFKSSLAIDTGRRVSWPDAFHVTMVVLGTAFMLTPCNTWASRFHTLHEKRKNRGGLV